jgi:hypothetical protein
MSRGETTASSKGSISIHQKVYLSFWLLKEEKKFSDFARCYDIYRRKGEAYDDTSSVVLVTLVEG